MFDGSEREHDEAESDVGGVEAVDAVDDQAHPAAQGFVAAPVHHLRAAGYSTTPAVAALRS
jgi:hypothetical protein